MNKLFMNLSTIQLSVCTSILCGYNVNNRNMCGPLKRGYVSYIYFFDELEFVVGIYIYVYRWKAVLALKNH